MTPITAYLDSDQRTWAGLIGAEALTLSQRVRQQLSTIHALTEGLGHALDMTPEKLVQAINSGHPLNMARTLEKIAGQVRRTLELSWLHDCNSNRADAGRRA
jgi:hypothetical protein